LVEYALGSVDEFADLEGGGPHGALAASDGCAAVAVVKELVGDEGAAETEETEFYIEEADGGGPRSLPRPRTGAILHP
jgi:hypothetical protein